MKKILVTGGTVFVSKIVAKYFASNKFKNEYQIYVLNRNNHSQVENVILINYQDAFFTPGISPLYASSRKQIRQMPYLRR